MCSGYHWAGMAISVHDFPVQHNPMNYGLETFSTEGKIIGWGTNWCWGSNAGSYDHKKKKRHTKG